MPNKPPSYPEMAQFLQSSNRIIDARIDSLVTQLHDTHNIIRNLEARLRHLEVTYDEYTHYSDPHNDYTEPPCKPV